MKQMIQLNEDYALSADSMNIILHQRMINQKEGSKSFGEEYYSTIGYFNNVESLLRALINRQVLDSIPEQTSLESLIIGILTHILIPAS